MSVALDQAAILAPPQAGARAGAPRLAVEVEVARDWNAVEAEWRALEKDGIGSPYQRFDWMRAFAESLPASDGLPHPVLILRDETRRPLLLMPLSVEGGRLRVASGLGGRHVNFHIPLCPPGAASRLPPEVLRPALEDAARRLGIDAFAFRNMPRAWRGEPNALAAGGRPSPSDAYGLTLVPDADALMERALSKDARKKLRQKEKYLAEIGPVSCRAARDAAEVDAFLAAFLEQKRIRFRELGIPDPFACERVRGFLRAAALAGLERGAPAVELHALLAGERVVAVLGAAVDARRCCGMFISFDSDPRVARCSPGDVLLARVVTGQARLGRTAFDLGVGEAAYKTRLCGEVEPLVDLHLPVTFKGRAFAFAAEGFAAGKRAVKRSARLWNLVLKTRAALAGLRG